MTRTALDNAIVVSIFGKRPAVLLAAMLLLVTTNVQASPLVTDPDLVDNHFEDYILRPCIDGAVDLINNQGWTWPDVIAYNDAICSVIFNAGTYNSSDTYASTSNLGSSGAQSKSSNTVAQKQADAVKDRLEEIKEEEEPKGGWGMLLSVQAGETERFATNLETGYESELQGFTIGADRRFDDQLVWGLATGFTRDEADFDNNSGVLKTDSLSIVSYITLAPSASTYFDAYLGFASLGFSGTRQVSVDGEPADGFGFTGAISSDFDGQQILGGLSGGHNWFVGDLSIGVSAVIDHSRTVVEGYDESGTTNLEMRYPEQTTYSTTSSLGLNLSHTTTTAWGAVIPNLNVSFVHQFQDNARAYNARLIVLPAVDPSTLLMQTDEPDRDYLLANLGVVVATNSGTQYFASYEMMANQDFMENWAFTLGLLTEF